MARFKTIWSETLIVVVISALLTACTSHPVRGPAVVSGIAIAEEEGTYQAGDIYFAGQLDEPAFTRMRDRGVTTVINLRSNEEMEELAADDEAPLDESAALAAMSVRYVHIPLGGDDGYEPADVQAFAEAIEAADGPVLVHCASGGRARTMWQAYLVKHRGYSLDDAAAVTRTVGGQDSAIERLLGRRVRLTPGSALPRQ